MSRDPEHAYDVGQKWAEDARKDVDRGSNWYCTVPGCRNRSEWRDEETGLGVCEEHAR